MKKFFENNNVKIRSITNLTGIILAFIAGLAFVLFIDLYVKFKTETGKEGITPISIWLFFAMIFAVVGAAIFFLGDSNKHKPIMTLVLKGIGLVLVVCYIFFAIKFNTWVDESGKVVLESIKNAHLITNITLGVDIASILFLSINYIFSVLFLNEDY